MSLKDEIRHYYDLKTKKTVCGVDPDGKDTEVSPFWQGVNCAECLDGMAHEVSNVEHRSECRMCREIWKKRP